MDTITVNEAPDCTTRQENAEFITDDWREDADGRVTAHVVMHLTNGRTILIGADGIYDRTDYPEDPNEPTDQPASVNWDELLQLLDGWRALRRQMGVN